MHRFKLILLTTCAILLFAAFSPYNAVVKEIRIMGNEIFSTRQILDVMTLKVGSAYIFENLSNDIKKINNLYYQKGFYFPVVEVDTLIFSEDSSQVIVSLLIKEGSPLKIGEINLSGNSFFKSDDIISNFQSRAGNVFFPTILEEDFDRLLNEYGRAGFPFASIRLKNISIIEKEEKNNLSLSIEIEEGKRVTIDRIEIIGNTSTKDNVIVRESRIKLHEIYNKNKVDKIGERLRRLGIFSQVEEPVVYTGEYGGGLIIKVVEGRTNIFDAVVGYMPDVNVFTGMVKVGMGNVFGTGRKIDVNWFKDERKSQEINLKYLEPWILNLPLNISIGFDQRQQDTIFIRRGVKIQGDLILYEYLTLGGTVFYENIIPSNTTTKLMRSTNRMIGAEIKYDSRDDLIYPTRGISYSSSFVTGNKIREIDNTSIQRIGIDLDIYLSLFPKNVLRLGLHGRTLSGGGIEIGDLYRFGGTNSMRGYRENQFTGKDIAWTNLEYRILSSPRSFVFGFIDSGYYLFNFDETGQNSSMKDYLIGYGLGIRLQTAIGNVGVSFGFGKGDSFLDGKIHFGLMNEF